jgi:hypothetical protein
VFGFLYKLENLVFDDNFMVTTTGLPRACELVARKAVDFLPNLLQGQISGAVIEKCNL